MALNKSTEDKMTALQDALDARFETMRLEISHNHDSMLAEIAILREARSAATGRSSGATALWGFIVGAIGLVAVVISIIVNIVK